MSQGSFLNGMFAAFVVGIIFILAAMLLWNYSNIETSQPEYPLSCGLSQPNESESYTTTSMYFIPVGKVMVPQYIVTTNYRRDLICENGTTIFEYE